MNQNSGNPCDSWNTVYFFPYFTRKSFILLLYKQIKDYENY